MGKLLINLPKPKLTGEKSVEECIFRRRSVRKFATGAKAILTLEQISQLLWSAQGITEPRMKFLSAPSAGALYPMELYAVLPDGFFHYLPEKHQLEKLSESDLREGLAAACWGQSFIAEASIDIIIAAVYSRVTWRYGKRGIRYTDMEAGHIAQNIHLESVALGLGSVPVGAFDDAAVKRLLNLKGEEEPIYIIPIGYPG
ncbi:MAG: SagB/ThcOx family dehydrogenase [Elusimicrobiota bacterium]|nr:SagB/ThcOx family dehydrogenase [Elusimicrobiota bacterium]